MDNRDLDRDNRELQGSTINHAQITKSRSSWVEPVKEVIIMEQIFYQWLDRFEKREKLTLKLY